MTQGPDSHINLYPELDDELDAAYAMHTEHLGGTAVRLHDQLHAEGILKDPNLASDWVYKQRMAIKNAWQRYDAKMDENFGTPSLLCAMVEEKHHDKFMSMYLAKETLSESGQLTPDGTNIAVGMEVVAIPWVAFSNNLTSIEHWFNGLVKAGNEYNREHKASLPGGSPIDISAWLNRNIRENQLLYRDPLQPNTWLRIAEYLDRKIQKDGEWGFMLMQTDTLAGVAGADLPGDVTNAERMNHTRNIDGINVDNMGVLEWLAYELQTAGGERRTIPLLANLTDSTELNFPCVCPAGNPRGGILMRQAQPKTVWKYSEFTRLAVA